jgi:hypothetical protein
VDMARKGWLEPDDILNARSAADVIAFAKARRTGPTGTAAPNTRGAAQPDPDADIPF